MSGGRAFWWYGVNRFLLKMASGDAILLVLAGLHWAPDLWNAYPVRMKSPDTSHAAADSVW